MEKKQLKEKLVKQAISSGIEMPIKKALGVPSMVQLAVTVPIVVPIIAVSGILTYLLELDEDDDRFAGYW